MSDLVLHRFPETLAVARLGVGVEIPGWAESSSIFSVTATATETTVVCAGRSMPTKVRAVRDLVGFRVAGEGHAMRPDRLVDLLGPLAELDAPAHTVATFDTVWVLVGRDDADAAVEAWRRRGWAVEPAPAAS